MPSSHQSKGLARCHLVFLAAAVLTVAGCASAYHCYEGCRINCSYCPSKPLAYPTYTGYPCHSDAADRVVTR